MPPAARSSAVPARWVDCVASLLALAGWSEAASRARDVRDLLLDSDPDAETRLVQLDRRIRRSRVLRWSLRGLGALAGLDAYDRLLGMLERAHGGGTDLPGPSTSEELSELLKGVDLAAARVIVASLDLRGLGVSDTPQKAAHA